MHDAFDCTIVRSELRGFFFWHQCLFLDPSISPSIINPNEYDPPTLFIPKKLKIHPPNPAHI